MNNIAVDVRHLELVFGIDLHDFEGGHTYALSDLMSAMGFHKHIAQRSEEEKRS